MHLLYASYIFIALRLSRRQPVIFCVLVEAVGILMRDLCMQLEPVRLLMDKNTLCTQTIPSICFDAATRCRQDGAGLKGGGAVGLKSGGGESQTWFKAAIRWKPVAWPCTRLFSLSSKKNGPLIVVLMGPFRSSVVTG